MLDIGVSVNLDDAHLLHLEKKPCDLKYTF